MNDHHVFIAPPLRRLSPPPPPRPRRYPRFPPRIVRVPRQQTTAEVRRPPRIDGPPPYLDTWVYVTARVRDVLYQRGVLLSLNDLVARFSGWRGAVGPPRRSQLRHATLVGRLRGVVVAPQKQLYFYAALVDGIAADFRTWRLRGQESQHD